MGLIVLLIFRLKFYKLVVKLALPSIISRREYYLTTINLANVDLTVLLFFISKFYKLVFKLALPLIISRLEYYLATIKLYGRSLVHRSTKNMFIKLLKLIIYHLFFLFGSISQYKQFISATST